MNKLTAVVLGASGLTGNMLLQELLKDNVFKTVRILVRRNVDMVHPKLEQEIVNFNDIDDYTKKFGEGDVIFSCIGTTQKKVKGDRNLYKKIDFDIPVDAARIGFSKNFKKFLIVSAVGANANASNFYLKLKGRTENALKEFPFVSIGIFQPSIISGNRIEKRTVEKIAQAIMGLISFSFFGPLEKYKAIGADNIARAMANESKQENSGVHYYKYNEMMELARISL